MVSTSLVANGPYVAEIIANPGGENVPQRMPTPTPPIVGIESDFQAAADNTAFALKHAAAADALVAQLGQLIANLSPPVINPDFPVNANAPAISVPVAPDLLPAAFNPPPLPAAFTGTLDVDFNFGSFGGLPPQLLFPNAPTPQLGTLPSAPSVDYNFAYPSIDVQLPTAPDLFSVTLSRFDGVTFPKLTATSPVLQLIAPQTFAYVATSAYSDQLLTSLKAFLLDRITNGTNTALPAALEDNIYGREAEREYRQLGQSIADLDRMEAMGYALPPGAYIDARIKLQTDLGYTLAGSSRDIAVAQAKLAQDNILKALETANNLESKLIDYSNLREQRAFEAVRYATQAGIDIYNAQVQAYAQRLAAYKSAIDAYTAQLEGAKVTVQVYQAEIDAEKLKVDINNSLVQQYKVQVDAALASIQVFQGEIDLIKTQAQIEQLKVTTFGEFVKAYAAQANVYQAQVEGYKAGVEAEQTKEQAYATSVQAYSALIDAQTKEINAKIEIYKAQIAEKSNEYEAYKVAVEGSADGVKAIAEQNKAIAELYKATVQGSSTYNEAMVKEWEATISLAEKVAEVGVQAAQAQGQLYLTTQQIASDAAKAAAQVEAQMAASALGSVTYATHRARQDSVSFNNSVGYSTNYSTQYGQSVNSTAYNSYEGAVLLHSSQTSSTSTSTSTVHNIQSVE